MPKIDTLKLRVPDPAVQKQFYRDVFGMRDLGVGTVGFGGEQMAIEFVKATTAYDPQPSDLYWKIALSVPDIDLACSQLRDKGLACSAPQQFRDVGYLAKLVDPAGFTVELIDHHFKGDRPEGSIDPELFGGGAHLSLLTLRTSDIATLEPEILAWGMTPLSVQDVSAFGFCLYFYAFTDERPPCADLTQIENRTWVYQRPYTVLEIQHGSALQALTRPNAPAAGYDHVLITSDSKGLAAIPAISAICRDNAP